MLKRFNFFRRLNLDLSGGYFQYGVLRERTVTQLESHGFTPYWHQRVSTTDGGIAFGQIAFAIMKSD